MIMYMYQYAYIESSRLPAVERDWREPGLIPALNAPVRKGSSSWLPRE
jgi:hypothetical protein